MKVKLRTTTWILIIGIVAMYVILFIEIYLGVKHPEILNWLFG